MKILIITLISLFMLSCATTNKQYQSIIYETKKYNLDFEIIENGIPKGWIISPRPEYSVSLDTLHVFSGRYSLKIESNVENESFQWVHFVINDIYDGENITFAGYIKTEDVDGWGGLIMQHLPINTFVTMQDNGVKGTTEWSRYEISLPLDPSNTEIIIIAAILSGKGKMWIDNLSINIDSMDISEANLYVRSPFPAELDDEFDDGSGIIFPPLNEYLITNLELLGRLWGFLKYHHPVVASGQYNWDYELFRMLPRYLEAKNITERDKFLLDWILNYGEISILESPLISNPDAYLKPDFTWLENIYMSTELREKIQKIYDNRNQGNNFYISMFPRVGNPNFSNERHYSDMPFPDAGFRLLSLYRYWNMINYFFPYKYITDKNWDDVLREYIPIFLSAQNRLEYEHAALQIIFDVNDSHAGLWTREEIDKERGNFFPPFRVWFIEGKLVVTDYYNWELKEQTTLEIGDVITHINGETVESIIERKRRFYPASNEAARLRNMANNMLRSNDELMHLKFYSNGILKEKNLKLIERDKLNTEGWDRLLWYKVDFSIPSYRLLEENIVYVNLGTILQEDVQIIQEQFKETDGIIIDIRNYPNANIHYTLGTFFVSEPTPFVRFTSGNINNPGEFNMGQSVTLDNARETYQGKLVVIINEVSQSAAEFVAMALRAGNNTTIIGSTTAGADGDISNIYLPGGLHTWITGIGVYYPDGTQTQRIGIIPDIWATPTIEGIKQGRDELLEKAIEIIKGL